MFILNYSVKINSDLLYLTFESPDGSHIGLSLSLISYKDKLTDRYSQSTGQKARDKNSWSVYYQVLQVHILRNQRKLVKWGLSKTPISIQILNSDYRALNRYLIPIL